MTLKVLGPNRTELDTPKATILFSYNTPVAARMKDGTGFVRTSKKWSATTSKHITQWLDGCRAEEKPQEFFDALA